MSSRRPQEYERLRATIRELRHERALSQFDLARRLGPDVRQEWISKIEVGERKLDVFELIDIAQALGLSLTELLERAGIPHGRVRPSEAG